ncbi:DUF2179 domain-containing protein [Thermohalobacter berrensis]|nr:DUF2179 domain-containing protein [Thermohalobacter berrensis]
MELFLGYLFIFFARITDVSLATMRMLMIVKGKRTQAALIGFFEVIIYITALGKVVSGLSDIGNLLAYALGFASGNYVGSYIEEKIALGNLTAQIVVNEGTYDLTEKLRKYGFGVTILEGQGKDGIRNILNITLKRKDLNKLHEIIEGYDDKIFITVSETRYIKGGYFSKIKKK